MLMTAIPAAMHLLVDGLCVCCLYLLSSSLETLQSLESSPTMLQSPEASPTMLQSFVGLFLTYNVLAFLTQPLTGAMADRMERRHWLLLASLLLLTGGVTATLFAARQGTLSATLFAVSTLLGLGNSLFHVWGGKLVALTTGNDMRALGVFVSTGAMGLALGVVYFSWSLVCVFLMALCVLALSYLHLDSRKESDVTGTVAKRFPLWAIIAAITALTGFVMLRSLVGETFSACVVKGHAMVLLIGVVAMLGKMAGGWIARAMGIARSMALVVALVAACMVLCRNGIWVILAGLFLVNCTMPVTLYLANVVLKGHEGLAFGLLAAALIPGYLLAVCG